MSLASSDPTALPVPAAITIPQGYWMTSPFLVRPRELDQQAPVTLTARFNGRAQSQVFTATPATPLTLTDVGAAQILGAVPANTYRVALLLNRTNVAPAVVQLSSSNSVLLPVPASITIPALSIPGDFQSSSTTVHGPPVGVDTPVVLTATLNGATVSRTVIIARTTDIVTINKAELVVKNLQLKVDAFSNTRGAALTLFHAVTGERIAAMADNGPGGVGGKFSFQGTVSPVTTLLVRSILNGTGSATVSQR